MHQLSALSGMGTRGSSARFAVTSQHAPRTDHLLAGARAAHAKRFVARATV
jgi:hypothetical protein